MIKEEYEKLKAKYNLPDFERINNEFELSTIEKKEFLLREIRRKIDEKIELVIEVLEEVLQPDANSFSSIYECSSFSEEEKKEIFEIYKQLMSLDRKLIEGEIVLEEKNDAEVVKEAFEIWLSLKSSMIPIVKELVTCWKKLEEQKEVLGYLG